MATFGDIFGGAGGIGISALKWFLIVAGGILIICLLGGVAWFFYRRKKWNLDVGVKILRSGGQYKSHEYAKGHYDILSGIVDIKRKGMSVVGMKPFDIKEFLQGSNYLEIVQIGATDYIPVHPDSLDKVTYYDELTKENKEKVIIKLKADLQKRKVWKTYMERSAKARFTLLGFLDKHWRAIEISIILFMLFIGFAVLWARMPSICG